MSPPRRDVARRAGRLERQFRPGPGGRLPEEERSLPLRRRHDRALRVDAGHPARGGGRTALPALEPGPLPAPGAAADRDDRGAVRGRRRRALHLQPRHPLRDSPPPIRDNSKSRDARLDLAWGKLTLGPVSVVGGRFLMTIPFTDMIWDRDL